MTTLPFTIEPGELLGGISREESPAPLYEATWFTAGAAGDGIEYRLLAGALSDAAWLTADLLLDSDESAVFRLELQEEQDGPNFRLQFTLLPGASARLRFPLSALTLGLDSLPREGACLKPRVSGAPVRAAALCRLRLLVATQADQPTRWCMTPLVASLDEPLPLEQPLLPRGPLLDALGQAAARSWPGKSAGHSEVSQRLQNQLLNAPRQSWPRDYTESGAWRRRSFESTGWFHTRHDGRRWWLVDPQGDAFWSAGVNGLRASVETCATHLPGALDWLPDAMDFEFAAVRRHRDGQDLVDFLQANLMRAFGPNAWHSHWSAIALAWLRRCAFNTIGHASDTVHARASGIPWTRTLQPAPFPQTALVWRDLPDVFDPRFVDDARHFAAQLLPSREDKSLLGYFLMDTPAWSLTDEPPAAGMLYTTSDCHSRVALLDFLRERHGDEQSLADAWRLPVTFAAVRAGRWTTPLTDAARRDLADFSALLINHYFKTLQDACRAVDPHHLNLGPRWHGPPPDWCLQTRPPGDVFSMSCAAAQVSALDLEHIHAEQSLPVLICAWGVSALDAGLPAAGPAPCVLRQDMRGQALRHCLENAAALPHCVGLHFDSFYDRSALGDSRGEASNCGLLDVCHRPCEPLAAAFRQSLNNLYALAAGQTQPTRDAPPILPPLHD